jgi:Icc-related predicted phosphoesterase
MNIVIFSDLHGKLLIAFNLVKKLQEERGIKVDYILQCGDAGIFPDISRIDRATLKHSKTDLSELAFSKFFVEPDPDVLKLLDDVGCPMLCVRGNHEDHDFLDKLENDSKEPYFQVDCYGKVFIIKTGEIFSLGNETAGPKILGIGRIGSSDKKKSHRYLQEHERFRLYHLSKNEHVDILLTHDSALDFITNGYGMPEIREVLDKHEPLYHFFGHTGTPFKRQIDENGFTISIKVAEFRNDSETANPTGSMILLSWVDYEDNHLEIIK